MPGRGGNTLTVQTLIFNSTFTVTKVTPSQPNDYSLKQHDISVFNFGGRKEPFYFKSKKMMN